MSAFLKRSSVGRVFLDVFDWYPSHLPAAEQKLLRKLDLSILIFASLSFFCKFLDQSNITNAYVSGMKEALGAYGNELNYYNVAYVLGQIPMLAIQSRPRIAPYFLPALEIVWAVLTFCQSRVTRSWHLYILRACVGFFEAPSFAGTHFILGSWYRREELFKRAGVWFMGNSLGSMFSGYLQAAAYTNLNGVKGLAGWQWCAYSFPLMLHNIGIITLPIAFIGFVFFPGLPNSKKPWFLTEEEHALAHSRMPKDHRQAKGVVWSTFKKTLRRPMWWICVPTYICMIQSSYWTGYMSLWLKSKSDKYSVPQINTLPTFINLISAVSSWIGTTLAGTIAIWKMWSFSMVSAWLLIVMTIWYVPDGLKFAAFYLSGVAGMTSPILYSWTNTILRNDPEERAVVMSSMMTAGYSTYIWVPLFTFPTVQAPRFPNGYPASLAFNIAEWGILLCGIWKMRLASIPLHTELCLNSGNRHRIANYGKEPGDEGRATDGLDDAEARRGSTESVDSKGSPITRSVEVDAAKSSS
ncbi:MFS general substrate transporter [Fistulina hepatica ATCC 64428]|uniref:MFS general substrate transporter n=1 Tax=Fistulina hepatica ATCC 64428 TaxID=1128425 RepID=A0A0D7AN28_9AGAR|nr:MFS general substrate transporter [Fistulina hepatica ATCC 64428]